MYDLTLYTEDGEFKGGERNTFSTDYPEEYYYFLGKTGTLESGIYDIYVEYYTRQDGYRITCDYGGDGVHYPAVYEESHSLSPLTNHLTYRIWVNGKLDNLDIRICCGTEGKEIFEDDSVFYVEKIHVSRDYGLSIIYKALKLLVLLFLIDGALFVFWHRRVICDQIRNNLYVVIGLTCIFMVSSLSVMGNFAIGQHDVPFHYARIIGLAEGMLGGSFPVKMQPGWLWGYGYPVSVFYGDILLYFPALLYMMGVPIIHAYKFYILVVNLGTTLISYFCYKNISGNRYIGVAATALYCLSIIRILDIYMRTAVGEYSAMMFLPLILLGMWQIYTRESKSFREGGIFLCLGMTGVIQTHIISTEMTSLVLAIAVILMIRKMTRGIFMALVKSVLATVCLNMGFLLPLVDYLPVYVSKERDFYGIQHCGLSIYELLSFGIAGAGSARDSLKGLDRRVPVSLGFAMLIVLILAVVVIFRYQDWKQGEKKEFVFIAMLTGLVLWMTTHYFPYNILAAVPGVRKIVKSIQFPWRFLCIAVPLLVYIACHVFIKMGKIFGRRIMYCALLVVCLAGASQVLYLMDTINRSGEGMELYYDYRDSMNHPWIAAGNEYLISGTEPYQTGVESEVSSENVEFGIPERKGTQITVSCQAQENARISFPLFAYKYYQCIDIDTKESFPILKGENNKIVVELPDYYQGTLRVRFVEPWYWRASEMVSLLTAVLLIFWVRRQFFHSASYS